MKSPGVTTLIKTILSFILFAAVLVACDNQQVMMNGGGGSSYMGNWNWPGILISLAIGFLIGYLVARRRK